MPKTHYHLTGDHSNIVLQCETATLLQATKSRIQRVKRTNPARAELEGQITRMENSLQHSLDCEITEEKFGYLRGFILDLFDAGKAKMAIGNCFYSSETLTKEDWSDGPIPGHSRGGCGGFLYRASDGEVVFCETTWIS